MAHLPKLLKRSGAPSAGRRLACATLLSAVAAATAPGCSAIGALAYKASENPTIPAAYVPDKTRPMLVVVERAENPADARLDADRIARYVGDELRRHKVAPIVEGAALADPRPHPLRRVGDPPAATQPASVVTPPDASDPYRATPAERGLAAGARQVLYVNLTQFSMDSSMGSDMLRGRGEATVSMLDADTGATLWPSHSTQGHLVAASTPFAKTGADDAIAVREALCQELSARIARLFFSWEADQVDSGSHVE